MSEGSPFAHLPDAIARALERQGFTALTPIQEAVARVANGQRDLRITSQTGSGKTIALGIAIARTITEHPRARGPSALVVAPTRELAAQVGRELSWLFAGLRLGVATITGGTSLGLDFRALERSPEVLVGTPGRIVDHLERGSIVLEETNVLVLDEADAMLDLGFRDELEAIIKRMPAEHATHLVSATFADEVLDLANRHQRNPLPVQGGATDGGHVDIDYKAYVVRPEDREGALVNLLLTSLGERTLVFVRTRADATDVAEGLADHGFRARAISGDMTQRERTATLEAFRGGSTHVLVATDVAARGLDVKDIAQVIQFDLPGDADTFTHRSGRTGRAGRKGTSVLMVPASQRRRAATLARQTGVEMHVEPLPTKEQVRRIVEQRALDALTSAPVDEKTTARYGALAKTLLETRDAEATVALLLARSRALGPCEPHEVSSRVEPAFAERRPEAPRRFDAEYVRFQVSWGHIGGADPRRLLAVACRRGGVTRNEVGEIRVLAKSSFIDVVARDAARFEAAVLVPDPQEPRIRFRRDIADQRPPQRSGPSARPVGKRPPPKGPRTRA